MIPLLRPTRETYLIKMHSILGCPDTLYSTKLPRAEMITAPMKTYSLEPMDAKQTRGSLAIINLNAVERQTGKESKPNRYVILFLELHC